MGATTKKKKTSLLMEFDYVDVSSEENLLSEVEIKKELDEI